MSVCSWHGCSSLQTTMHVPPSHMSHAGSHAAGGGGAASQTSPVVLELLPELLPAPPVVPVSLGPLVAGSGGSTVVESVDDIETLPSEVDSERASASSSSSSNAGLTMRQPSKAITAPWAMTRRTSTSHHRRRRSPRSTLPLSPLQRSARGVARVGPGPRSSTTEADVLSKPSVQHRLGTVALSSTLFLYEEGEQVLRPERLGDEGDHARVAHGTFTGFARHRRGEHGYLQAPNGVEKVQDVEAAHPRHFEIEQENAWKHASFCCPHHLGWAGEVFDGGDGHGVTDDPPRQEPVDLTVIDKPNTHEVDLPPCPRSRTAQNRPEQHVSLGKPPQTVCRRAPSNEPLRDHPGRRPRYARR